MCSAHLRQMVMRPTGRGRSVFPAMMSRAEQDSWRRAAGGRTDPLGRAAAGAVLRGADGDAARGLVAGQVSMRLFTVAHGSGYVRDARLARPGAGGRTRSTGRPWSRSSVAKDVWVRSGRAEARGSSGGPGLAVRGTAGAAGSAGVDLVAARAGGHVLARPVRRAHRGSDQAAHRRPRAGGRLPFPPRASRRRLRAGAAARGERRCRGPGRSRSAAIRCCGSGS